MRTVAIDQGSETEMDMRRRGAQVQLATGWRWFRLIPIFQRKTLTMATPRRSIDREEQEHTPSYE